MASLNPRQFRQQRLINPLSVARKQPHQMGLKEFADSPHTMWHGSHERDFNDLRSTDDWVTDASFHDEKGFHVGTLGAADERMQHSHRRTGYFHPVRIDTFMDNTRDTPYSDRGESWTHEDHDSFYRNEYEDVGSVSAIVSSPHAVKTYGDFVGDAMKDPKKIPSGEAQWRHENNRMSFQRQGEVGVEKTDKVAEVQELTESARKLGIQPHVRYERELKFTDPRTGMEMGADIRPPGFRGEQGFMFEGPGTKAPRVREHLINKGQFGG